MRQIFLEAYFRQYRSTMSVDGKRQAPEVDAFMPLNVVTDCCSLHETVAKSGMPDDKRAAIEVIALREMIGGAADSDSEVDEDERLNEEDLGKCYKWCISEGQKADILTKRSNRLERDDWHSRASWISI